MTTATPTLVPMLTRGKHRSPRKGACFMEFASYLAGESWSDHPRCTHPLLAAVARLVNDNTSDDGRQRLTGLIPSVIGLTERRPPVERGDRQAGSGDRPAAGQLRAPARPGGRPADVRAGARRARWDGRPRRSPTSVERRCRRCLPPSAGRGSTAATVRCRPPGSIGAALRASSCWRSAESPKGAVATVTMSCSPC